MNPLSSSSPPPSRFLLYSYSSVQTFSSMSHNLPVLFCIFFLFHLPTSISNPFSNHYWLVLVIFLSTPFSISFTSVCHFHVLLHLSLAALLFLRHCRSPYGTSLDLRGSDEESTCRRTRGSRDGV